MIFQDMTWHHISQWSLGRGVMSNFERCFKWHFFECHFRFEKIQIPFQRTFWMTFLMKFQMILNILSQNEMSLFSAEYCFEISCHKMFWNIISYVKKCFYPQSTCSKVSWHEMFSHKMASKCLSISRHKRSWYLVITC